MISQRLLVCLSVLGAALTLTAADASAPAFSFRQVEYFHRWSGENQHEFTPAKQEDLQHWTDMITINAYPGVDEGEKMAGTANAVLANYQRAGAKILNSRSVPRTEDRPAEHFICARFGRPGFVEVTFARFKLVADEAHAFIYSHRVYGEKAQEQMEAWFKENRTEVEKALMDWQPPEAAMSGP